MGHNYFQKSHTETLRGATAWLIFILMNSTANIETFNSFSDGSGAEGIVSAFGFRFAFCYGSELVVNPLNRGDRFGNKAVALYQGALRTAESAFVAAVDGLGAEWAAKHAELYK